VRQFSSAHYFSGIIAFSIDRLPCFDGHSFENEKAQSLPFAVIFADELN
jgi:hypothetical protein